MKNLNLPRKIRSNYKNGEQRNIYIFTTNPVNRISKRGYLTQTIRKIDKGLNKLIWNQIIKIK